MGSTYDVRTYNSDCLVSFELNRTGSFFLISCRKQIFNFMGDQSFFLRQKMTETANCVRLEVVSYLPAAREMRDLLLSVFTNGASSEFADLVFTPSFSC